MFKVAIASAIVSDREKPIEARRQEICKGITHHWRRSPCELVGGLAADRCSSGMAHHVGAIEASDAVQQYSEVASNYPAATW